jgi:polar amino acid transport system substrate-binding protein
VNGRLRVLAAILGMALVASACGGGGGGGGGGGAKTLLADVMSRGELRVSTDPAYPPQSELTEGGTWRGFDIDVAREVAKRLGVKLSLVTPSWNTITSGRWQGRWDLSIGSMTITPERQKVLDFTTPYYFTPASVAVHEDNTTVKTATDLDGQTIGVCGGCTYESYLEGTLTLPGQGKIEPVIHDADVKTYDTDSSAIQDLSLGDGVRLDAAMSALPTLQEAIKAGKPIKIVGDPLFFEPLAMAVDKEAPEDPSSFVKKLTGIVEDMHKDGTLTRLSIKYYGTDLTVANT